MNVAAANRRRRRRPGRDRPSSASWCRTCCAWSSGPDQRPLLPNAALLGAILLILADNDRAQASDACGNCPSAICHLPRWRAVLPVILLRNARACLTCDAARNPTIRVALSGRSGPERDDIHREAWGQITAIVGRTGRAKTTLLRCHDAGSALYPWPDHARRDDIATVPWPGSSRCCGDPRCCRRQAGSPFPLHRAEIVRLGITWPRNRPRNPRLRGAGAVGLAGFEGRFFQGNSPWRNSNGAKMPACWCRCGSRRPRRPRWPVLDEPVAASTSDTKTGGDGPDGR